MDMLINRLYRTRVQIDYEPQDQRQGAPSKGGKAVFAYAGKDTAELSPLSIVFYITAQKSDGSFQDLSDKFSDSPFTRDLDDYGAQFKKTIVQYPAAEKTYPKESLQNPIYPTRTVSDDLEFTPQEVTALLHFGEIAKNAYLQANHSGDRRPAQQMIDVVA